MRLAPLLLLLVACGSRGPVRDVEPGERPDPNSTEAGLWLQMDRIEQRLKTSGRLVTDPRLNTYVRGVVGRIAKEHATDIRVYVVRAGDFNASMAPNGMMVVWTGLLLRVENEAQLAYVLAHELKHYLRRHSLQRWRDMRSRFDSLAFFNLGTAAMGLYSVGDLATLATIGKVLAFSREHEREADTGGLEIVAAAGYDPREAARVWENLIAERDAAGAKDPPLFWSTHPSTEERTRVVRQRAGNRQGATGRRELLEATLPHRGAWLREDLRHRRYERTAVLLDRLEESPERVGQIHYFRGEMLRLQGKADEALAEYERAVATPGAPAEAYRSLGHVYWAKKQRSKAEAAFREYLAKNPRATDRAMVESYLERLRGGG